MATCFRPIAPWPRVPRMACLLLVATVLAAGSGSPSRGEEGDERPQIVELVIDYGDGVEKHFTQLKWKTEMTVLDAMHQARKHRRGIRFEHRGKSSTVLLTQIDDIRNDGSDGRNWIFRVNKKIGNRSIGIYRVEPGDTILWRFETYR